MNFSDYQRRARETAIYMGRGEVRGLGYVGMGLAGSAGQVAEHLKKVLRDDNTSKTPERRRLIKHYLGAVLWYVAMVAHECGMDLDEIAEENLATLAGRAERGTLHGDGPDR